jgi:hypothetical protein
MPEEEKRPKTKNPEAKGSSKSAEGARAARTISARVERSLKDADRLLREDPEVPPQERAMAQLEQAKASALLQLANAIRENRNRHG